MLESSKKFKIKIVRFLYRKIGEGTGFYLNVWNSGKADRTGCMTEFYSVRITDAGKSPDWRHNF